MTMYEMVDESANGEQARLSDSAVLEKLRASLEACKNDEESLVEKLTKLSEYPRVRPSDLIVLGKSVKKMGPHGHGKWHKCLA